MKFTKTIFIYLFAGLVVVLCGALAGWYFFLRSQMSITDALGNALGLGVTAPFGAAPGTSGGFEQSGDATRSQPATAPPQLWHVTPAPIAGFCFATSSEGVVVRYVERQTGYIFDAYVQSGAIKRITNTLMPKTYEAQLASGGRLIGRSIDKSGIATTFTGTFSSGTSSPLTITTLRSSIEAVVADPKAAQFFSIAQNGTGIIGTISTWNDSKRAQVFSSAVPGWRAQWLTDGRIIVSQKAASSVLGYSYVIKNGVVTPLIGGIPGLVIVPRSGSGALLYSTSAGEGSALYVQPTASSSTALLPLRTIAEKCVWAPGAQLNAYCGAPQTNPPANFLDAWYRGEVHTADAIWKIDAGSGQTQLLFTPDTATALDVQNPAVDDVGEYIGFMNATDQSLWVLRINK